MQGQLGKLILRRTVVLEFRCYEKIRKEGKEASPYYGASVVPLVLWPMKERKLGRVRKENREFKKIGPKN